MLLSGGHYDSRYLKFFVRSKIEIYKNYSLRTDLIAYSNTRDLGGNNRNVDDPRQRKAVIGRC